MKLYELKRGQSFKIIDGLTGETFPDVYEFHKIDGMYSICLNVDGEIIHVVAYAKVIVIEE